MALEFEYIEDPGGPMVEATARLCRTEDDRLVPEGDPAARWLYTVPGRMIPRAEAEKYGLLQDANEPAPEPDDESDDQEVEPAPEPDATLTEVKDTPQAPDLKPDLKAIRAWAIDQGLDVPKRGRIPEEVVELYNEEHLED